MLELSMMENPQGMWQRTHDAEIQGTKQARDCLLAASGSVKGKNSLAKSQAQYLHCRVIFLSPEGCCTNTACSWKGLNTFCIPGVRHSTGLASQPLPTGILLFNNLDFNNLNHLKVPLLMGQCGKGLICKTPLQHILGSMRTAGTNPAMLNGRRRYLIALSHSIPPAGVASLLLWMCPSPSRWHCRAGREVTACAGAEPALRNCKN